MYIFVYLSFNQNLLMAHDDISVSLRGPSTAFRLKTLPSSPFEYRLLLLASGLRFLLVLRLSIALGLFFQVSLMVLRRILLGGS